MLSYPLKVLYVEDEEMSRRFVGEHLERRFESFITAPNGAAGLELFMRERPDIVIADIRMPIMDGLDMAAKIKELNEETPIVIITAHSETDYMLEAIEIGVDHFLIKPIDLDKLDWTLDKVAKIVMMRRELQEKRQEMIEQLYTDPLTGLPNRIKLLADMITAPAPLLALVNIDSFKEINDFYGHSVGDFILEELAVALYELSSPFGIKLYKLQSDEYALLRKNCEDLSLFSNALSQISEEIGRRIFMYHDLSISLNITIGAAVSDTSQEGERRLADELLAKADMALKTAKRKRVPVLFYNPSMQIEKEYEFNLLWSRKLKQAIEEERIEVFYQPIFSPGEEKPHKFEALVRLIEEDGRVVSPYFFLNVAKRTRLYPTLTRIVVEKTLKLAKERSEFFSINISIEDIQNPETVDFIIERLSHYGVGERIAFEILESDGIEDYDEVNRFITRIREQGCAISIDDFGSGYSNFVHLVRMEVDFLKIDASLVKNIDTDPSTRITVEMIVMFAKRLGIATIAEFVHSKEVYDIVVQLGVDYIQGYYTGEPVALGKPS